MFTWLVLINCEDTTMTPVPPRLLFIRCASSCFSRTKMHSCYHRLGVFSLITMQKLVPAACYFPIVPASCLVLSFLVCSLQLPPLAFVFLGLGSILFRHGFMPTTVLSQSIPGSFRHCRGRKVFLPHQKRKQQGPCLLLP